MVELPRAVNVLAARGEKNALYKSLLCRQSMLSDVSRARMVPKEHSCGGPSHWPYLQKVAGCDGFWESFADILGTSFLRYIRQSGQPERGAVV